MPKTAEQEKLEGYPGHRRVNKKAPIPDHNIPGPPQWLGRIGKNTYRKLVGVLGPKGMNVIGASDQLSLAMVCDAFEEYRSCSKCIKEEGPYFINKIANGEDEYGDPIFNTKMSRNLAILDRQNAWNRVMTGLGRFGLNPYARQKVSVILFEDTEKTREEIMKEKREAAVAAAIQNAHIKVVNE